MTRLVSPDERTPAGIEIDRLRNENARLREALEPLAVLQVPFKPKGNAGAYSIRHKDIERARDALGGTDSG